MERLESRLVLAFPNPFELSNLIDGDGTTGFAILGVDDLDFSGWSVSAAGDVNGDGFDDLVIGAPAADPGGRPYAGETYVVFGRPGGFAAYLELSALDGATGFVINGIDAYDGSGGSVSAAGDVNGDGFDDLIVGAPGADPGGRSAAGETYVVFGRPGPFAASMELSALDGTNGFHINGIDAGDFSGGSVSKAGDVNGDGFDDLVVGARYADPAGRNNAGETYVIFGRQGPFSASLELSALDGTNGFVINGVDALDYSGNSVGAAGDINGDGFDDLLVGAFRATPGGRFSAGRTYVVFGHPGAFAASLELSALDGTNGFLIDGIDAGDNSGFSVSGTGDVNGDGFDDLIVGAPGADPGGRSDAGETYVVFGRRNGFAASLELSVLDGTNGIVINGIDVDDGSGGSVSAAGDVNGDGFDDLVIGAGNADPGGRSHAGETYVVFGRPGGFAAYLELSALDGTNGFVLNGLFDFSQSGFSVSGAGDVNGDGFGDLVVGAVGGDPGGRSDAGETYVVFGRPTSNPNLQALDGTTGYVLNGIDSSDRSGGSVSGAGDVNGDGFDDLVIGAVGGDPGGRSDAGETYVVFGRRNGLAASLELSALDGTNGFLINGIDANDFSGGSVSNAGDVNGDGFGELVIGARSADPSGRYNAGETYVIFGRPGTFSASLELSALDGTNGFVLNGVDALDYSGNSVSAAGDINGDGFDDLLVGAFRATPGGRFSAGRTYVVFGRPGAFAASLELSALDGTNGFVLDGVEAYDYSGQSVSAAGDVNGDGFDDLMIGAPYADPGGRHSAGKTYIVFGRPSPFAASLELSALDGTNGFVINGIYPDDRSGNSVSTAGDVNGDGFADLLIGAFRADTPGRSDAGQTYVVFGRPSGFAVSLELAALDGTNGFIINGIAAGDDSGWSVSAAGDVNGDGLDDLVIGAIRADPGGRSAAGETYVVFGRGGPWAASLELWSLDGANGFVLDGIDAGDTAGFSVSGAGDINGDGFDDLVVGAVGGDPGGRSGAGEAYVVFGSDGEAPRTLSGDATGNKLIGGLGSDTLAGNGGADVLRGGRGDDVLAVSDALFASVRGGNGLDTLRWDATGGTLDLTAIADNRLTGIERIDLDGSGANTLVLDLLEVLNISDESNRLVVLSGADDSITIGTGWTLIGTVVNVDRRIDTFMQGAATLVIERSTPLGDLNADGLVNRIDAAILSRFYGKENGATLTEGDLDGDGRVGLNDLSVLQRNFSDPSPSPAAADAVHAIVAPRRGASSIIVERQHGPSPVATLRSARNPLTPTVSITQPSTLTSQNPPLLRAHRSVRKIGNPEASQEFLS